MLLHKFPQLKPIQGTLQTHWRNQADLYLQPMEVNEPEYLWPIQGRDILCIGQSGKRWSRKTNKGKQVMPQRSEEKPKILPFSPLKGNSASGWPY